MMTENNVTSTADGGLWWAWLDATWKIVAAWGAYFLAQPIGWWGQLLAIIFTSLQIYRTLKGIHEDRKKPPNRG
jgi:hypothetical protein